MEGIKIQRINFQTFTLLLLLCIIFSQSSIAQRQCAFISRITDPGDPKDAVLIDSLIAWGYNVTIFGEDELEAIVHTLTSNYDFVFASETVNSNSLAPLRGHPLPLVTTENWASKSSALAYSDPVSAKNHGPITIRIIDRTGHFLSAGMAYGTEFRLVSGTDVSGEATMSASPTIEVIPIAGLASDESLLCVYGVESGMTLTDSSVTVNRSVVVGLHSNAYAYITEEGYNLIQNGIEWILETSSQVIDVWPAWQELGQQAGDGVADVHCINAPGESWDASVIQGGSWLSITSGSSGTGDGQIVFHYDKNSSGSPRKGIIEITGAWAVNNPCQIVFSQALEFNFTEIKEIFLRERAQTGDLALREACFGNIDDLILGIPPVPYGTIPFYKSMIEKAIQEIKAENVTRGATIWQIYNHGFVVKTPSKTFGFDLKDYYNTNTFLDLANILDARFISHEHRDHYSISLINEMKAIDKPVVGPAEWSLVPVKMNSGDTRDIAGLSVTAHYGLHSAPVRQFEVVTSEGLKFLHTGDNQTSETLPDVGDIDVMLLNGWINESGTTSWIEGIRIAINKMKPETTLPGHILELGHIGGRSALTYRDIIAADDGTLASDYYLLAWGERYHYKNASNDSIPPNEVKNLNYSILADSISFSWDLPQVASDGDTASFYRVVINDTEDFFTTEKEHHYTDITSKLDNAKVYSYDDCGNQSLTYAETKTTSGFEAKEEVSLFYDLAQNYPNPFNHSTTIRFRISESSHVTLKIFNIFGKEITTLVNEFQQPNTYSINFNASKLPGGIYFYQIRVGNYFMETKKMLLIR